MSNCIGALLIGALIYGLLSPDVIFMKAIGSFKGGSGIRMDVVHLTVLKQIRNYLPDMLWAFALVFALCFLIGQKEGELFRIFITAAVFSAVLELLQMTPYVRGTFDPFDILAELLAEALAVFVVRVKITRKWRAYEENSKNSGSSSLPFSVRRDGTGKRRILKQ